jgi:nitrate/TMAO reductase-like tetraheme cytochrome c subunit
MRRGIPLVIIALMIFFVAPLVSAQGGGGQEESVCLGCHDSDMMKPEFRSIPSEWKKSWHYQNNVSCHDCHGGDPKDAAMAMSPERGFVGKPNYAEVPEFCGKCHIGILKNYLESGHGKALKSTQSGPNCVTCHGSHEIQKADISIINEKRCSQCHTYDRARTMKQTLFVTEKKIRDVERGLRELRRSGVFTEEQEKTFFSTEAGFRTLFHSVDVSLIKDRTNEFTRKLDQIDSQIRDLSHELLFRKNFAAFLMLLFLGICIVFFSLSKTS